ncbi:ABC transporter permease [Halostreptopolyspora alba]|uniref:ABC transporter permease n=1 Tax=Halostreptopolyspora alba TaxID=2487137 RepID=A0A3N0E5Z2_9ACTN|nr:ABC transporter permease [Nocardiopsaceae bacterium YIM 96095]
MSPEQEPAAPSASPSPPWRTGRLVSLAVRLTRGRLSGLLAIAVAVLGGAAFVTVGGVLADTGLRSHPPVERMPGADAVVTAQLALPQQEGPDVALPERAGVPDTLVERLERLPEVAEAAGDVGFPAAVVTADGVESGSDPRPAGRVWTSPGLVGASGMTGEAPRDSGDVALDTETARAAGAEIGDEVRVTTAGHTSEYRLSGVVDTPAVGIFFDGATAADLAGRTDGPREATVDAIGLRAAPEVSSEALAETVRTRIEGEDGTDAVVHTGAARGDAEIPEVSVARAALVGLAGSLGGVVLLVIGFVVAGAVSVSVAAQRRDLALVRAVGATPRQIRRLVAVPTVLTALGTLPFGIAAGYPLAGRLYTMLAGLGVIPTELPVRFGALPAVATAVLLPGAVWLAAVAASWRTAGATPVDALAETVAEPRAPRPWRVRAGAALLLASTALAVPPLLVRSEAGIVGTATGSLVAVIGLALVGPTLVRAVSGALARRLPARTSPLTWLAVHNLHGHSHRVAGAVVALAMAVALTLGQCYAHTTVLVATERQHADSTLADYRVTAPEIGGVPDAVVATLRDSPEVTAAVTSTPTSVVWRYRELGVGEVILERHPARALGPGADEVLDLGVTAGDMGRLAGETVALGESFARLRGVGLGDRVTFHMGDGAEVRADVVALYEHELGHEPVVLSRDLAVGHVTGAPDTSLLVRADPADGADRPEHLIGGVADHPGVEVETVAATDRPSGGIRDVPPNVAINVVVLLALLGYVLLSVANRLAAQTLQRGTEVDTLRSLGMTPGQTRSLLRREAAMIAVGAVGAGALAAAVPLALAGIGFLGRPWPGGPGWLLPATALTVALLAWLSVELPGRRLAARATRR